MTQIALPTVPKFSLHTPARPMMARDADSMYWMGRYVERAEHIARLLLVNSNLLTDVGDLAPRLLQQQWQGVLTILRTDAPNLATGRAMGARIARYVRFTAANPNSALG